VGIKTKFELEYTFNTPVRVLYQRLSTPEGLAEWFADDVIVKGDIFTFIWQGTNARARLVSTKENKSVKFEWLDFAVDEENEFEFLIATREITGDNALIISDYAESEEKEDAIYLWDTQVARLKNILGLTE